MSRGKARLAGPEETPAAGFVSRWSRLKREAVKAAGTVTTGNVAGDPEAAANRGGDDRQASAARILTDEDMPGLESLTPESDYTGFFSPGVSDALRKLALRKLFQGKDFNIRDGLDEYDDDYTSFEKLGDIVTSDMRHQFELEAQRKAEQLLQHNDQSKDAGRIHDVETKSGNDEPVDERINITARDRARPDAIQQPADGVTGHESGDGAIDGKTAITRDE